MPADHSHAAGQQGTGNQRSVAGHWEGKKLRAVGAVSGRQVDDVFTLTSAQLGNTYAALCS